jgi:hypothetical protein
MTKIMAGGAAAVALGAYLKWAVQPVLGAYRIGRIMGRRQAGK